VRKGGLWGMRYGMAPMTGCGALHGKPSGIHVLATMAVMKDCYDSHGKTDCPVLLIFSSFFPE